MIEHGRDAESGRHPSCRCGADGERDAQRDTYFCPVSGVWLEDRCSDPTCSFCSNRPEKRTPRLKVFLGSPCYDSMEPEFVGSLIATMDALRERGHEVLDWGFVRGTLPHFARNSLAAEAMSEEADVMVQIDTDHQWRSGDLVAAVECVGAGAADVVGYAHVSRSDQTLGGDPFVSPKMFRQPELRAIRHAGVVYVEVRAVGAGIFVASRRCLERLSETATRTRQGMPMLFKMSDDTGEDFYFCEQWIKAGGRVYCHRDAIVAHIGKTTFAASFQLAISGHPIEIEEDPAPPSPERE